MNITRLEIRLLRDSEFMSSRMKCLNAQRADEVKHSVMNLHMNRATEQQSVGEIDIEKMKRYITYCKR